MLETEKRIEPQAGESDGCERRVSMHPSLRFQTELIHMMAYGEEAVAGGKGLDGGMVPS